MGLWVLPHCNFHVVFLRSISDRQAPFGDFGQILRIDVSELLGHQPWIQWIGLRENLQETIDFPIKY